METQKKMETEKKMRKIKRPTKKLRVIDPETDRRVLTYTFCECGENHVGGAKEGERAKVGEGFNEKDLKQAIAVGKKVWGCEGELHNLKKGLEGVEIKNKKGVTYAGVVPDAHLLIMRDLLTLILKAGGYTLRDLMNEACMRKWDRRYYDTRRQKVLNKHPRENHMVAEKAQKSNYDVGGKMGTTHAFSEMPILSMVKAELAKLGDKFPLLIIAEGNKYNDGGMKKHGIGYHGDAERRMVMAMRLGVSPSMPFYYQWWNGWKSQGKRMEFNLNAGDVYVMSEWAVGTEWKSSSLVTLRHATGAAKFTEITK
jgi:hypothetical protein